ncbi:hypothetical protein KRP22_012332 [Phytophthora ramorum]|nr:hypothetical protein KRP22_833 [Phytophthora ramorum]
MKPRSLRVGLDLDDDDEFSMESSSGDEKEDIGDSDPPQISKQQIIATQANERQEAVILQNDNEDGSQNSEHLPPYSSSSVVATSLSVMAVQFDDRSSGESQAGDSIESFHSEGSDERTRTLTMETPRPTLQKTDFQDHHNDSAGDYDESLQSPSQQIETRQTYAFTSVRPQQSIASESEVYDEDAFEEDSTVMTHAPAHNSSTVAIQPTVSAEKNFDYSMDFSDDEDKRQMQLEYSSLRGIERFIADRRVQKLELWEALMRVDPTLDERMAREAARGDDVKH